MIRNFVICCGLTAIVLAGCETHDWQLGELNDGMVQWHQIEQVDAAIIREHTIYAHNFVTYRAELNEIGQRNVNVLARHYADTGGTVNVSRGDASDDLYSRRVDAIMLAMTAAGVPRHLLTIDDAMPGGDGMPTEAVLRILEQANQPEGASTTTTMSSGADDTAFRNTQQMRNR